MNEDKAKEKTTRDAFNTPNERAGDAAREDRAPGPQVADEEFAECIYEDCAPIGTQDEEKREISVTGGKLRSGGYPSGVDAPGAEES